MKNRSFYAAVIVLLVTSILPNGSSLGSQPGSAAAVLSPPSMSDFITVWTDNVDNIHPAVAYNPQHEEYLVVWVTKQDEYTWDLWGQRVHSDGSLVADGWFNIDSLAGVKLSRPIIAYNQQDDQYLIVYTSQISPANYNIWGKVIDWNGAQHNRLYLETAPLIQDTPALAYNSQDPGYLLAYHSEQPAGGYFIELRALAADGNLLHAHTIVSPAGEFRMTPSAVYNPMHNEFFLVYGLEFSVGLPQIIGRTISPDLSQVGLEFEYTDGITYGLNPTAALGRNEYLVSWFNPSDTYVAARRADLDGSPLGRAGGFIVAIGDSMILRSYPRVARLGHFGYLVAWNYFEMTTPDVGDVFGRLVGFGKDQPLDAAFAIDARANYQGGAALTCTPAGECLVVNTHNPVAYPLGDLEISGRLILTTQVYLPLAMR
jgi:hypothetical protein